MRAFALTMAATLISANPAPAQAPAQPDLIFLNGVIYTGQGFAEDRPQTVQAIAIANGKILAIGTNAQMRRLAGPKTRIRDLDTAHTGVYLFPGFDDAHVHLGMAASMKMNLDLSGADSLPAMLAQIASFARTLPPGHWITGGQWDQTLWASKALPTREELDRVTGSHPAFLSRIDGHIAIANTAALQSRRTSPAKPFPLKAEPSISTRMAIPPASSANRPRGSSRKSFRRPPPPSAAAASSWSSPTPSPTASPASRTSATGRISWSTKSLRRKESSTSASAEWIPFREPLALEEQQRAQHSASDPMLHTAMLKGFMDGSLGSRTAALKQPYADDPGNTGLPQYTQAELNQMAVERAGAGFQLGFHAIGDRAVSMALDAYRPARHLHAPPATASSTPRSSIPADIPRFKQLGVIASMQPCHLLTDMNWAEARLGPQRARYSYAWKAFLDAGVRLAFGTDYPVEPISPLSRPLRRRHPHERSRHKELFPAGRPSPAARPSTLTPRARPTLSSPSTAKASFSPATMPTSSSSIATFTPFRPPPCSRPKPEKLS